MVAPLFTRALPFRVRDGEVAAFTMIAGTPGRVVKEFEQLARDRAVGRENSRDTSEVWQTTPPKLRLMIHRYTHEPAQVQEALLKKFATKPALAQSIEEHLKLRREQVYELGLGRGRGL